MSYHTNSQHPKLLKLLKLLGRTLAPCLDHDCSSSVPGSPTTCRGGSLWHGTGLDSAERSCKMSCVNHVQFRNAPATLDMHTYARFCEWYTFFLAAMTWSKAYPHLCAEVVRHDLQANVSTPLITKSLNRFNRSLTLQGSNPACI